MPLPSARMLSGLFRATGGVLVRWPFGRSPFEWPDEESLRFGRGLGHALLLASLVWCLLLGLAIYALCF